MSAVTETQTDARPSSTRLVLLTLAAGQFLMILDSSVMNVSMAQVADDLDTTITGIQTAITLYTLVMASLMITGGKLGSILGRRRAFGIGLVIYGIGSFTTALAPNLTVLLIGWSLFEGMGAALILPAIVALVAANVPAQGRAAAYGMVAAAGGMAVAAGPLIGGAVTTFASWRYVFAGEVIIVIAILLVLRKINDVEVTPSHLDLVGSLLSIVGLSLIVLGVLQSGDWGWLRPQPDGPTVFGTSPVIWMITAGLLVLYCFLLWQNRMIRKDREPLVDPEIFENRQMTGGLIMFFFQYIVQAGVFFAVPLFLSVALGLSALETGVRIFPLSVALLVAAAGIPKLWPTASPRRVVRLGLIPMLAGTLMLVGGMDPGANATVVSIPMLLLGLGMGALSSQLGAVTVSALPDERAPEVGGLQNTVTNLGISLGTALVGSVLIAALSSAALAGISGNTELEAAVQDQVTTEISSGVAFVSDAQLEDALAEAGVDDASAEEIVQVNSDARLEALQAAFAVASVLAALAFLFTGRLPTVAPGSEQRDSQAAA
jgi:EmrB/QacA subfamily drug resistance transporter